MILLPQQVVYFGFYCTPKKLQIEISAKRKKKYKSRQAYNRFTRVQNLARPGGYDL